jgi:hypothetical protein
MFAYAAAFNQPLGSFKTPDVKYMDTMFKGAYQFNQPLNKFDTSIVTSTNGMFENAKDFNQDVSTFKVGGRIRDMSSMFEGALSFAQHLTAWSGTILEGTSVAQMFK